MSHPTGFERLPLRFFLIRIQWILVVVFVLLTSAMGVVTSLDHFRLDSRPTVSRYIPLIAGLSHYGTLLDYGLHRPELCRADLESGDSDHDRVQCAEFWRRLEWGVFWAMMPFIGTVLTLFGALSLLRWKYTEALAASQGPQGLQVRVKGKGAASWDRFSWFYCLRSFEALDAQGRVYTVWQPRFSTLPPQGQVWVLHAWGKRWVGRPYSPHVAVVRMG